MTMIPLGHATYKTANNNMRGVLWQTPTARKVMRS